MEGVTRRRLLEGIGATSAGIVLGRLPSTAVAKTAKPPHQRGIATRQPAHLRFAAFDVTAADRAELTDLMRAWSATAKRLTSDRHHKDLTITFGFGPALFDDRYGLAPRKPRSLNPLPSFFG